jgi:hypothetical protein
MTQKPVGINVTTGLMCVLLFVGVGSIAHVEAACSGC